MPSHNPLRQATEIFFLCPIVACGDKRSFAVAASMRRPAPVKAPAENISGDPQGGGAPLVGGAALFAAWGEPSRPGFPLRGNGKGEIRFLAAAGAFPSLPTPIRPASIRTLHWSLRSGAIWGPQSQRVLPSRYRTGQPRFRSVRSTATSQSPEPGDWANSTQPNPSCCLRHRLPILW